MITRGDLVRPISGRGDPTFKLGIVLELSFAWPGDPRDETQIVKVLGTNGLIIEWYDWQLYVIDEWAEAESCNESR